MKLNYPIYNENISHDIGIITYVYKDKVRKYVPDFFIKTRNNKKILIEVKSGFTLGLHELTTMLLEPTILKLEAAEEFCIDNDIIFMIYLNHFEIDKNGKKKTYNRIFTLNELKDLLYEKGFIK